MPLYMRQIVAGSAPSFVRLLDVRQCQADGKCLDCGADIPITRLLAAPSALRCIDCQTAAEKVLAH